MLKAIPLLILCSSCAISPAELGHGESWISNPTLGDNAILDQYTDNVSPGLFLEGRGYLTTFGSGDTRYYPMFFDGTLSTSGGVPFLVGPPLIFQDQAFDVSSSIYFSRKHITVALSTTDNVYTQPGSGAQWRCDIRVTALQ